MITTTGTSGKEATLSANLGEHQRHVPSAVAMQMALFNCYDQSSVRDLAGHEGREPDDVVDAEEELEQDGRADVAENY